MSEADNQNKLTQENPLDKGGLSELAKLFDLLAQFDFEDKKKEEKSNAKPAVRTSGSTCSENK